MDIYYRLNEDQFGPIDNDEFTRLAKENIIDKEVYIWYEGLKDWIKVCDDELFNKTFKKSPPPFKIIQSNSNIDSYEFAIEPSFEYAEDFFNGLAIVRFLNGKSVYINLQGIVVHEFDLNKYYSDFYESFAFYREYKETVIGSDYTTIRMFDKSFKNIGDFKYNGGFYNPSTFEDSHLFKIDDYSIISGGYLLINNYSRKNYIDRSNFFIDLKGKKVFTEYEPRSRFSENFALVLKKGLFSNKFGLLSAKSGEFCVEFDFKYHINLYRKLSEGIICLFCYPYYDFFDSSGNKLFSKEAYSIGFFKNSLCPFKKEKDGLIGFFNNKGEDVIQLKYKEVGFFNEGLCPVKNKKTEKWGYIDLNDNLIINYIFDFAGSFNNNLAKVSIDGKLFGFIKNPLVNKGYSTP